MYNVIYTYIVYMCIYFIHLYKTFYIKIYIKYTFIYFIYLVYKDIYIIYIKYK